MSQLALNALQPAAIAPQSEMPANQSTPRSERSPLMITSHYIKKSASLAPPRGALSSRVRDARRKAENGRGVLPFVQRLSPC